MTQNKTPLAERIQARFPWTISFFFRFPWLTQFFNFSIVGAINFVLSYALYGGGVYIGLHHQIANQIAFWVTILNGYLLNKFWVFGSGHSGRTQAEAIRYLTVYGTNYVLGIFLLYLYVDVWGLSKYLAPIIAMPITIPLNYILNRKWIFAERRKQG